MLSNSGFFPHFTPNFLGVKYTHVRATHELHMRLSSSEKSFQNSIVMTGLFPNQAYFQVIFSARNVIHVRTYNITMTSTVLTFVWIGTLQGHFLPAPFSHIFLDPHLMYLPPHITLDPLLLDPHPLSSCLPVEQQHCLCVSLTSRGSQICDIKQYMFPEILALDHIFP